MKILTKPAFAAKQVSARVKSSTGKAMPTNGGLQRCFPSTTSKESDGCLVKLDKPIGFANYPLFKSFSLKELI